MINSGVQRIVGQRAKHSGMHWTVDGATSIIALHCHQASGRWQDFVPSSRPRPDGLRAAV